MSQLVRQKGLNPTRKVGAGALAGAIVTLLAFFFGEQLADEPSVAALAVVLAQTLAGWLVRERKTSQQ